MDNMANLFFLFVSRFGPNLFAMSRTSDDPPDSAEDEDLESIYSRIRELEQSIVTLGMTF